MYICLVRTLLKSILLFISIGFTMDAFAATKITTESMPSEIASSGSVTIATETSTGTMDASGSVNEDTVVKHEMEEQEKKDKEKTINDINTFLIESYKLKIDKVLANLNISLERVTNNNPIAQAKLLEKIRGDISTKIQVINSRNISGNRKKILSSVFSYIQENLDAKISRLVKRK